MTAPGVFWMLRAMRCAAVMMASVAGGANGLPS